MFPGMNWAVRAVRTGLVFSIVIGAASAAGRADAAELPPLPQAIASFGAATVDHYVYVYGGHSGKTHSHSVDDQSGRFQRLDLEAPKAWENLGDVEALQGLALVPWQGSVCKIGGMKARNKRGEPDDLISVADFSCWSPTTREWTQEAPLPEPRSSHDAVTYDGKIYVTGGWRLAGQGAKGTWIDTMLVYEPAQKAWRSVPQPFQRRALATVAAGGKIYTIGGIDSKGGTSRRVDAYDIAAGTWAEATKLPYAGDLDGFGAAAVGIDKGVLLSASDGIVQALPAGGGDWRDVGERWREHRFFHRMLIYGNRLLALGGATSDGHSATFEYQTLPTISSPAAPAAPAPAAAVPSPAPEASASPSVSAPSVPAGDPASWPGFRGRGDGQAPTAEVSAEAKLAWRLAVPGYGQSSPVVWGDQALLTSVVGPQKEELILSSFDLESGEVRWRRRFPASLLIKSSDMVSRAAPTPVVDAERIYAFWESGDVIAVDHQGETVWRRRLAEEYGKFEGNHGIGSSPVLADGVLVVQITHAGPSYLLGLDAKNGQNLWKHDLPAKVAWTSPAVHAGDKTEVIVSANGSVESLDARSGQRNWVLGGLEKNTSASPVVHGDLVIAPGSEVSTTVALRLGGRGELTADAVLWRTEKASASFASPVFAGGCLILINKAGVATCVDPATGQNHWQERLGDEVWATPIAAGDRVFFFTKKGKRLVYQVSPAAPLQLASEELGTDDVVYGAAAAPGAFLLRTGHELLRLSAVSPPVRIAQAAPAVAP